MTGSPLRLPFACVLPLPPSVNRDAMGHGLRYDFPAKKAFKAQSRAAILDAMSGALPPPNP